MKRPLVKMFVLPGGKMPRRRTGGAVGYDVHLRALVSPLEMDPDNPALRRTIFDFETIPGDPEVAQHARWETIHGEIGELVYVLEPGESVVGGIGFATEMPFPTFYLVGQKSGLSSKPGGVQITNLLAPIDPDYRGEAGVVIRNPNNHEVVLWRNMRITQIIFLEAVIPRIKIVRSRKALSKTKRGVKGFGSTGLQ